MIAAIFIIIGLILLIFIHELGHFLAAKQAGIKVEEFGFGFPPRIMGWRRGETLYSINWLPLGGFVRIYGERKTDGVDGADGNDGIVGGQPSGAIHQAERSINSINDPRAFYTRSFRTKFVVIAAGISINFIAGWLLLSLVFMLGAREAVVITEIQTGSPAEVAQLQRGDELVGFVNEESFITFTRENQDSSVKIKIVRDGEPLSVDARLRKATEQEAPLGAAITKIGFPSLSFFNALKQGMIDSVNATAQIFMAFGRLVGDLFSHASVPENVVGPVGIFGIAGDLGRLGFVYIIQLVAMISLNLAALNAIPFPALDGGRILFMIIEKLKGSPIAPKKEMWANISSFGFLIILMLIITGRDIVRLF